MRIKRKRRYQAIEPDEILIDAQNLPRFDTNRLEGKIERPIEKAAFRNFLLLAAAAGVLFSGQLVRLQVLEAATFQARSEANRLEETLIIAPRGSIVDRVGTPLALNAPDEALGFSRRAYPLGEDAAHLLGYVSYPKKDDNGFWFQTETQGLVGIESLLDPLLAGENGAEIKEVSATGSIVSGSVVRAPKQGGDVALSIDAALQTRLFEALQERSEDAGFIGGSGVIMDIQSGELLSLASYPSFDPNAFANGDRDAIERSLDNQRSPLLDRAVSGLYTPGSVVKPFVALAALEEGIITPDKKILSTGSISIPNPYNPAKTSVFRDWRAHGWVNMRQALAVSSDVYFYEVGGGFEDQRGLGIATIDRYMRLFGFGEPTGSLFADERSGTIPTPAWKAEVFDGERWFLGDTYHTAIGQYGFQVTALQLVRAVAAIANGGTLVTPTIIRGEQGERKTLDIAPEHFRVVQEGMRLSVEEGTAAALSFRDVAVAGKTGTAEVGAKKESINSLVVGFFPYHEPRFAFAIIMERAKAGTTAGAPLAMRQVLEWMIRERPEYIGITGTSP